MSESTWLKQLFRGRLRQLSADRRETRKAWIRLGLTRLEDRRVLDAGAMVTDLNLGAALVSSVDTAGEGGGSDSNVANSSSGGSGFDPLLSSPSGSVAEASPSHSSFAPPAWWHHSWHCAPSKISIVDSTLLFRDVRGRDNSLVVFSDDTNLHIIDESGHRIATDIRGAYHHGLNEVLIPLASLADVREFVVDTDGGSDSLSLDLSGNADSLLAQFDSVYFDAGHSDPSIRGDVLQLVGGNQVDASVTPDAYVTGDGYALLADAGGSTNVYFTDVEAVDVTGMQTASLVVPATPTGSDALVVSDGLDALTSHDAALVVQGAVGGTPIESVHFYDNTQVVIDTAAGGGGLDQVTILGASGDHDNVSLSVEAGDAEHGSEGVVAIVGNVHLAGDLRIEADRVHFDADIIVCGTVELLARDGVQFSGSGSIWAIGAGGVVIDGDVDNQGGGLVTMADGFWVNAGFGTIAVHSDGDVTLGRLVTDNATAQAIRIESTHGGIVDAGDRYGPDIEANATGAVVTILARDQVGGSGSAAIDTKAFSLVVRTADSDMFVEEWDQLTGIDINVGAGAVYLSAGGAIYDAIGDSSVDIRAASAVLKAVGIGTASDPLETQLARLEVDADDGGIWLENQGDLQIGGASSELSGLTARGSIVLHVIGSLTVEETIVSQGGHIRVSATEDITLDSVIASGGGSICVAAAEDVVLTSQGRIDTECGSETIHVYAGNSIRMAEQAVVEGRDGDIVLRASGDIALSRLHTMGDVTVSSTSGALLDANGNQVNIQASRVSLSATSIGNVAAGMSLDTEVAFLEAIATRGDVSITEVDGLQVVDVRAPLGNVSLVSIQGDLVVQTIEVDDQVVLRVPNGSVIDDGDAATGITAGHLVLDVGEGVGMLGDPSTAQLETSVQTLSALATTGLDIANQSDQLAAEEVIASGDAASVRIVHQGGDMLLGTISILPGTGTIVLLETTDGAILDQNGSERNILADGLGMRACAGIGTQTDPLEVQVDQLELVSRCGGAYIKSLQAIELGGLTGYQGVQVACDFVLESAGSITVSEPITSAIAGRVFLQSVDDVLLGAAVTSRGGSVEILADNSILADQHGRIESSAGVRLIADHDLDGAGTIQFAADIVMGTGFTTFHLADTDGLFSGSLSGPGGLAKQGPGTLRLTDTSLNTYRGTTEIETGVLVVDGAIGSGVPVGRVTISPEATLSGSGIVNAPIYADAITARIISSGNLQLGDGSQDGFDFAGVFVVGAGHQVMLRDADIAHLGLITTIEQGGVLGVTGDVEVSAGELLAGHGMVQGGVIVLSGGEITPGIDVGTLGTGRLMLHSGAQFTVEIYGATAGSEYDQLRAQGPVSLGGARLNLDGPALDFGTGTVFVLIENTSGLPVAGHFVDASGQVIPEGGRISGNGFKAVVSYSGGQSGNDVTLTVVNRLPFFVLPPSQSPDQNSQRSLGGIFALGADLERTRIRRAAAALLMEAESVRAPQSNTLIELQTSDLENTARSQFRVFLRVVDDGLRKEIDRDYELQPTDLADPLSVFHRYKFPNGHYRVYVQEAGSNRERLVLDVHIYDGKVVPAGFRNEGASELPGPSEKELPAPGNPAERESVTPYENGAGKIVEPAAESSRPMQPLAPTKPQDRPVEGDESAGDMTGNESSRLVAVGIGIAQLATVHQWRVRVRDAMNSTGRDVSRVSRLMRRADRRGKSFKRRSL